MARYYRRYRRYRPRRYVRRWFRRRFRRYVNGSSKSTIRVKCNQTVSVAQNAGYGDDGTSAVVYALNPYYHLSPAALVNNALYQNYVRLYEETKMIGMKLEIAVTSPIGGADTPSLQLYTCFDRRHGYGELAPTVDGIKKSSSSIVSTALNNNVAKIVRSIYASDLIEKAQWHDSELDGNGDDKAWVTAATNPNFFTPSFFMFLNSPTRSFGRNISVHGGLGVIIHISTIIRQITRGNTTSSSTIGSSSISGITEGNIVGAGNSEFHFMGSS